MNFESPVNPKMSEADRPLFAGFPQETRQFYNQLIFVLMLNQAAVKSCLFDTLFADTDDVFTWMRFYEQLPELKARLGLSQPKIAE